MIGNPQDYEFRTRNSGAVGDAMREWIENVVSQGNILSRFAIYEALEKSGERSNPLGYEDVSLKAIFNFAATHKALDLGLGNAGFLSRTALAVTKIYVANMAHFYDGNPQYTDSHGEDFFPAFVAFADRLAKVSKPTHDSIDAYFFKAHAKLRNMNVTREQPGASGSQKPPKIGNM